MDLALVLKNADKKNVFPFIKSTDKNKHLDLALVLKNAEKKQQNGKNGGRTLAENHAPSGGAALSFSHKGNLKVLVFFK